MPPPLGNPWFTFGIAQWLRILVLSSHPAKCTESMCLYTVWDTCRMFNAAQASGHLESIKWYSFVVAFGTRLIGRGLVHVQRPTPPPRATDSTRTQRALQGVTLRDYEPQLARMRVSVDWIAVPIVLPPRNMSLAAAHRRRLHAFQTPRRTTPRDLELRSINVDWAHHRLSDKTPRRSSPSRGSGTTRASIHRLAGDSDRGPVGAIRTVLVYAKIRAHDPE